MSSKTSKQKATTKTSAIANVIEDSINVETVPIEETKVDTTAKTVESPSSDVESVVSDIKVLSGTTDSTEEVKVQAAADIKFALTDKIPCKSLFYGKLVYTSPTNGAKWVWKEYGSVQHIPYGELEIMNNHKPKFLTEGPLIVILEPSIIEDLNLTDIYRKVASINKFGKLVESGSVEEVRTMVQDLLEVGMREAVIAEVRKCRTENTLTNINLINMLNSELKTDIS